MPRLECLERTQVIARRLDEVFPFFADAANLEALPPGFLHFRVLTPGSIAMRVGTRIDDRLCLFGVAVRWRTHIADWQPGVRFVDEQEAGPFRVWRHTHQFESHGSSVLMRDTVEYAEPLDPLGWLAHHAFVRDQIFDYRRDVIESLLDPSRPPSSSSLQGHVHVPSPS